MNLTQDEQATAIERQQAGQTRFDTFHRELTRHYRSLFANDPEYKYAAATRTPEEMARAMTLRLAAGTANKDGKGIKRTCKSLHIPHTYGAICEYINA